VAYTTTWNGSFELSPADSDNASEGAERIRELKEAIRSRMEKDHYMDTSGTDEDHGEHKWVTLREQSSAPSNVANKGFVYTKDVSGATELFYEDDSGNEIQLTNGGSPASIPSGSKMLFYADTAPSGWTLINTMDDKLVFVTKGSGAGGQTGGGTHSSGTWAISGLSDSGHTHGPGSYTVAAHNHQWYDYIDSYTEHDKTYDSSGVSTDFVGGVTKNAGYRHILLSTDATAPFRDAYTSNASPSVSGGTSASGNASVSGNGSWRPAAYCFIVCSKD